MPGAGDPGVRPGGRAVDAAGQDGTAVEVEAPARAGMQMFAEALSDASVPVRVGWPLSPRSEAEVMWSKLVRLNGLACTTSAYDLLLGEIRSRPELRRDLEGAITEGCEVGRAEGAEDVEAAKAIAELDAAPRRSAARCSETSPPGARPSSMRSQARC